MTIVKHTAGRDRIFEGSDIRALLLYQAATPDPDDVNVVELTADELSDVGYGRVTMAGYVRTVNTSLNQLEISWDPPNFGAIVADVNPGWITLYESIGGDDDTQSLLIESVSLANDLTTDGEDFILPATDDIWFIMPGGIIP